VIVRCGTGQGSGTIIASVDGETLVLTAAHVVRKPEPVAVELHRYNLGVERSMPAKGWPLAIPAEVAARDPIGDVAVLRIRGRQVLPFVARLAPVGDEPKPGMVVASVGVDNGGDILESWQTDIRQLVWFRMGPQRSEHTQNFRLSDARTTRPEPSGDGIDVEDRPYLITTRAPQRGRSGGGLFRDGNRLVGVCVGRIELARGQAWGVFASCESVRRLLRENELEPLVTRSEARPPRLKVAPTRADKPGRSTTSRPPAAR
jgi:hypothetical protein